MKTQLETLSEKFRQENIQKNIYLEKKSEYGLNHPNAKSDGDDKGKDKIGGKTDINTRIDNIKRNIYKESDKYRKDHPNAVSDGDEWGKEAFGGKTDIKTRTDNVKKNMYNDNKTYPNF